MRILSEWRRSIFGLTEAEKREQEEIRAFWRERSREKLERLDKEVTDYICPVCYEPISTYTAENDYLCEVHSFVNPIRKSDGAVICGDGQCGVPRVLRYDAKFKMLHGVANPDHPRTR